MKCLVCGSASVTPKAVKNTFEHFECTGCNHIFVDPMPTQETLNSYYRDQYSYGGETKTVKRGAQKDFRHAIIEDFLQHKELKSVLDIGSADGAFLKGCSEIGIQCLVGFEPNKSMVQMSNKLGFEIIPNMFSTSYLGQKKFDLINLGDVIEHVQDPIGFLDEVASALSPGGLLFISTPNVSSPWSRQTFKFYKFLNVPWSTLTPPEHLNNFSNKSLNALISRCKFHVILSKYDDASLPYELGHTHLFRRFREKRSIKNLLLWVIGWVLYINTFYICKFFSTDKSERFRMHYVVTKRYETAP
jgi:SAM-dependent methyltransferase